MQYAASKRASLRAVAGICGIGFERGYQEPSSLTPRLISRRVLQFVARHLCPRIVLRVRSSGTDQRHASENYHGRNDGVNANRFARKRPAEKYGYQWIHIGIR